MEIFKRTKQLKEDANNRIFKIEDAIRDAYKIYVEYKEKEQNTTYQDYLKLEKAIKGFYYDQLELVEVGRLNFDYFPIKMYASMKHHKNSYCRKAIKNLDIQLKKEGIIVDEMLKYLEVEKVKYANEQNEEDVRSM